MSNPMRFKDKTVIITGGAGDIGSATAKKLFKEGASVALVDIDEEKLKTTVRKLKELKGGKVSPYICDVTDFSAVEHTVKTVVTELGSLDLVFNNAGYQGDFKPIHKYPPEDFEKVIRINLIGAFYVLKSVGAAMVQGGGGAIVNTASMAGVDGPVNMPAYGASKFGIVGLTESAAKDLAPYGIRVNAVSPGFMGPGYMWDRQVRLQSDAGTQYYSTDPEVVVKQMINSVPMRRYGNIDEIPDTVAFLLSDESSYITGVNIPISGGIT